MDSFSYKDISSKYDELVDLCKKTGNPIYLTNDKDTSLVVMDVDTYNKREQYLLAEQLVLESYYDHLINKKEYSLEESNRLINELIYNN